MAFTFSSCSRPCQSVFLLTASCLLAAGAFVRARAESAELTAQTGKNVSENQAAEAAATDKFKSTREEVAASTPGGSPMAKVSVTLPPPPKNWALQPFPSGNIADLVSHPAGMTSADTKRLEFIMNPPTRADEWCFGLEGNLKWNGPVGGGKGGGELPKACWGGKACQANVDLDVDSDNNAGRGGAPSRSEAEDGVEMTAPGKYVEVNDGDTNNNQIPDFAELTGGSFTPLVLELSSDVDLSKAMIELEYDASTPGGTPAANTVYTPATGKLRLWASPAAGQARKAESVAATSPGNFVPQGSFTPAQLGMSGTTRSVTLLMEGIRPSAAAGDIKIKVKLDPDGNGPAAAVEDSVLVTTYKVDFDVDSDNDGTIDPAAFCLEDQIEDDSKKAGKFIAVNDNDDDDGGKGDGIPDFADGFDKFSDIGEDDAPAASEKFTPLVLRVSKALDLTKAKFKVENYSAADPNSTSRTGTAPDFIYAPGTGNLRIWTKDGNVARKKESANAASNAGHFVVPGVYTATQLGLVETTAGYEVPLYIEGIKASAALGDLPIKVKVLPTGDEATGGFAEDQVRVTVVGVDLDVDSDNDDKYSSPKRTTLEDAIEAKKDRPGKILELNVLDRDYDGVPDFADGYDIEHTAGKSESGADKSYNFAPMILELKEPIDLAKAQIKFTYSDSFPSVIERTGTGTKADPYVYAAEAVGKLRIWTKDGAMDRKKASVEAGGHFVPKGVAIDASKFGATRIISLYVEAVGNSAVAGDLDIKVEVDPDGSGPAGFIALDIVKVTVVKVEEVHPLASDFVAGKEGRVVISTNAGDTRTNRWWTKTDAKTTAANGSAQVEDKKVVISAYVTPKLPGVDVYFEVTDPDDLSPYEARTRPDPDTAPQDENPNDNRDSTKTMVGGGYAAYQTACLSVATAKTQLKTINGTQQAVAETTLTITGQFSGDNYRVRAVCRDPQNKPFDALSGTTAINSIGLNPITTGIAPVANPLIPQSATLVAWKRIYLEYDQMYKKGATLTANFVPGVAGVNSVLTVDNTVDFAIGDDVVIFDAGGVTRDTKVVAKTATTLVVLPVNVLFGRYSGVKLKNDNTVYDAPRTLLTKAYGLSTDGADGGCFVEFEENILPGGGFIAKYTKFTDIATMADFCLYWHKNPVDASDVFQIVAATKLDDSGSLPYGISRETQNRSAIFCDNFDLSNFEDPPGSGKYPSLTDSTGAAFNKSDAIAETTVHEIGHQWLNATTTDGSHGAERDWSNSDGCVMSYVRVRDNGIVDFDRTHLDVIRNDLIGK